MKKWERISAYIFLLIGINFSYQSLKLSLGEPRRPGPGFAPFGLGLILILLALILIYQTGSSNGKERSRFFPPERWKRPFYALLSLVGYALLVERLGYIISTLLLVVFWIGFIEKKGWFTTMGVAILATVFIYLTFGFGLNVPLPLGILAR